ncbi:MAG TPA: hypothetical protein VNH40_12520 [Gaiellaceae bacterium]|nr:hypothetical protein [Gaiellaceae bacterium]
MSARGPEEMVYDLLLLHGTAVERAEPLPTGVAEGDSVWVSDEEWTVAAVRESADGTQLVCVRGL